MTDLTTNLTLLHHLRADGGTANFICHANNLEETELLYREGASYVTLPHYIGSERVSGFLKRHGIGKDALKSYREKHLITIGRQALRS
jgi:voltage-gated potassium channel Kch